MPNYVNPLIDDKNPLYCPTIPAAAFLRSLRSRTQKVTERRPNLSRSFAHILEQSSHGDDTDDGENTLGSDWILGDYFTSGHGWFSSQSPGLEDLPPYSPSESVRAQHKMQSTNLPAGSRFTTGVSRLRRPDLKRKGSFSDFGAPPKYARSIQSVHDSSFDIEVRREQLQFTWVDSSPQKEDEVIQDLLRPKYDINILIENLDSALPGIRLKERLRKLGNQIPQALMDFLAEHGYINLRSLNILRDSDVDRIAFAPSMFDENGLNISGQEIYSVFSKPNSFCSLSELSFSGIHIRDSDLQHIHHLPNLSVLLLDETGITNEAVFLLVSLKRTLTRLSLATNPDINNDAVPAILLLSKLSFLSILDTGIGMIGLRRLAETIHKDNRVMDVEIPFACEDYVDHIHSHYFYNPLPPLITNPEVCTQLSSAALKRNLEAHAACNASIVPSGTRCEMVQRLYDILQTRRLDVLVVTMLGGDASAA